MAPFPHDTRKAMSFLTRLVTLDIPALRPGALLTLREDVTIFLEQDVLTGDTTPATMPVADLVELQTMTQAILRGEPYPIQDLTVTGWPGAVRFHGPLPSVWRARITTLGLAHGRRWHPRATCVECHRPFLSRGSAHICCSRACTNRRSQRRFRVRHTLDA
jgi:hypothetical protein